MNNSVPEINRKKNPYHRNWILAVLAIVMFSCSEQKPEDTKEDPSTRILSPLEQVNKAIESAPSVSVYNKRAKILLDSGDVEGAFEDIKKAIAIDSGAATSWMIGAKILRENLQIPLSLEYAKRAESLGVDDESLYLLMTEENLILMQYQDAISYSNKALKVNNRSPKAYYYKGLVYEETKDFKRAISSYQTALEQDNQFADAYNNLIKLFTAQDNYIMANQYVESGLRFLPEDIFVHYNYGILVEKQGLTDSALTIFYEAERLDTTFDLVKYKIAHLNAVKNNNEEAAKYFSKLLELNPTFELAYSEYGELLIRMEERDKAREMLRKGLIRYPESESIKKWYDRSK